MKYANSVNAELKDFEFFNKTSGERASIVRWLREMHVKYHANASPAVEADYETGKAMAFAEAANAIERGDHLKANP